MPGKSGNGRNGKHGYYEHSWATKRDSTLTAKIFKCDPHRVPAKKAEPIVWEQILDLLSNKTYMTSFIEDAKRLQDDRPDLKEKERLKAKLYGINSQVEALAERVASLPKDFPAKPLFDQLEKLDAKKKEIESQLTENHRTKINQWDGEAVDLSSLEKFSKIARDLIETADIETKKAIVRALIGRIEFSPTTIKIGFYADKQHYNSLLKEGFKSNMVIEDENKNVISGSFGYIRRTGSLETSKIEFSSEQKLSKHSRSASFAAGGRGGSHSLTIGAPART